MNKFNYRGLLGIAAVVLLLISDVGFAACTIEGKVVRLRHNVSGNVVDIAPLTFFPTTFTFFTVPNDRYYAMLASTESGNLTVVVSNSVLAACPPAVSNFVNGGTMTSIDMVANR